MTTHYAVLLAAGSSVRMGMGRSKMMLSVAGKPILFHAMSRFVAHPEIHKIILVTKRELFDEIEQMLSEHGVRTCISLIEGGRCRQESSQRGIAYITSLGATPDDIVLIHDAARCLVSPAVITESIAGAKKHGAITTAVPVVDTLIRSSRGCIHECISREHAWSVQTPQCFRYALIAKAHQSSACNEIGATDDASLVNEFAPVHIVEGERTNIKVTTPMDIALVEVLLKQELLQGGRNCGE